LSGYSKLIRNKKRKLSLIALFIVLFEFNLFFFNGVARTEEVSGFWKDDTVNPNESVVYNFPNNLIFEISTNSLIKLHIEYENKIQNKQASFIISNNQSISLNIQTNSTMKNFGISKIPQGPKKGNVQLRYRYNCIFKLRSNVTIENITIQYQKSSQFGFNPKGNYSIALFKLNQESWELIKTDEEVNESTSELYLESEILDIEGGIDYFITIFEFGVESTDWTWLIVTITVGAIILLAIVILISKKDYIQYLRKRTIPIEKGAHRLTLDEVLENENRNKIIDLILEEPGIHFNELLRKTKLAAGNLVWHLDILETYKIIGKKRIKNYIAYFPYYQKNPLSNIDLQLSKSKLTLEILEMIEEEPGIWNNIITGRLKVDHKTINYHIQKLIELDLIHLKKDGRKKKIYPNLDSEYFQKSEEDSY
jgi:DNA-binding transcriptional ArsR family regulator